MRFLIAAVLVTLACSPPVWAAPAHDGAHVMIRDARIKVLDGK